MIDLCDSKQHSEAIKIHSACLHLSLSAEATHKNVAKEKVKHALLKVVAHDHGFKNRHLHCHLMCGLSTHKWHWSMVHLWKVR